VRFTTSPPGARERKSIVPDDFDRTRFLDTLAAMSEQYELRLPRSLVRTYRT